MALHKYRFNPLLEYGITHIQCYSYVPDKNTADMVLAVDAMDQLYKNGVDVFCIVSSDSDFAPLVNKIIEEGRTVIGMGESKAVKSFRNSCNEFILLDEGEENITPYDQVKADIEALIVANEAPMRFKLISDKLGKKYHFDPENYDCDTMVELLEKMGFTVTFKNNFGKRTYYAELPMEETADVTENEATVTALPEESLETDEPETAEAVPAAEIAESAPTETAAEPEPVTVETAEAVETAETAEETVNETVVAAEPPELPTLAELKNIIVDIMNATETSDGAYMLSRIFSTVHDKIPGFSPKKYGARTPTDLVGKLGLKLEKRYKKGKSSGSFDAYVRFPDGNGEENDGQPDLQELTDNIIDIIKSKGNEEGRMAITHIIQELSNRYPGFSIKKYNLGNATKALNTLGFDTANNYAGLGKYQSAVKTEEESQTAQSPATEEVTDTVNTENAGETEIEIEVETDTDVVVEVETVNVEETETAEASPEAEETTDGDEFSQNGMPLYVDLPEAIDTKEQLRNAIIFILSTESVTSATRLSAPLKRYFPNFKIKNYGHSKMKSLLEDLGLFVF